MLNNEEKKLLAEGYRVLTQEIPERLTALEIAIKGNGTKGLGQRMNEVENKVVKQGVTLWKVIVIIVASSGGTVGIAQAVSKMTGG